MGWEPLPSHSRSPQRLGAGLDDVLRRLSGPSAQTTVDIFTQWASVVGEQIAQQCQPRSLDGKTLVIAVQDPAWASELKWMEKELLHRIQQHTGSEELTRIRVKVERVQK